MGEVIDPLSIVLWASWVMHPIIVTWGCSPCPSDEKSFLVRHVKQTMSMREGGTACRKVLLLRFSVVAAFLEQK